MASDEWFLVISRSCKVKNLKQSANNQAPIWHGKPNSRSAKIGNYPRPRPRGQTVKADKTIKNPFYFMAFTVPKPLLSIQHYPINITAGRRSYRNCADTNQARSTLIMKAVAKTGQRDRPPRTSGRHCGPPREFPPQDRLFAPARKGFFPRCYRR